MFFRIVRSQETLHQGKQKRNALKTSPNIVFATVINDAHRAKPTDCAIFWIAAGSPLCLR